MKKITLLTMLVALFGGTAFAQQTTAFKCIERTAQTAIRKAPQATAANELVTPPASATVETWHTTDGVLFVNTPSGPVEYRPDIQVAIDGSDIYLQGLAYWFPEGWVKGTISETTATFATGQFVGEDEYGPEYICGTNDAETLTDIVFDYDATEATLKAVTIYILENSEADVISPYCYWAQPTFGKEGSSGPQPVVAPEGLETDEWAISAMDNFGDPVSGYVNIGFDGNDCYMQGFCHYLPETWLKGTLEGDKITFPGNQYFGPYDADYYTHYEFYLRPEDVVFTYDAEAGKMTAEGEIYVREAVRNYKGDVYNDPVITKVIEKAATPATPSISQIYDGTQAPILMFTVPTVDTEGNALASSKLFFQFFKDVEQEISDVTFDPADYPNLTEAMTIFPYGFTCGEEITYNYMHLKQADYSTWNKIGMQVIYLGGGEENKSEIFWFDIKPYEKATFDFNAMTDEPCSSNDDNSGDINEDRVITANGITLTISPKTEEATTPNRFWSTNNGPQLRVYSGTLTFEAPVGKVIQKMVFNNGRWNNGNSADSGAFEGNVWTGEAKKVVVTIAGNTQINSIEVYPTDYIPTAVEAPEGLVTDTYIFQARSEKPYYDPADLTLWVKAGFDGDDVYIQGLASDYNSSTSELWVKATKNETGQYVIPANQFMGSVSFWMSTIDCYFTAVDAQGNMVDAVLDYDAEKGQFTTDQPLVINASLTELNPQQTFTGVTITKFNEVAATPADPTMNSLTFDEWSHYITFYIPQVGTEGETLNPQKLFYTIWIQSGNGVEPYVFSPDMYWGFDGDTTELPWSQYYSTWDNAHSIYFYDDAAVFEGWAQVGVQSIYYGGDEVRKSAISWIETPFYTGIENISTEQTAGKAIYNISGQRITAPAKGLNIINGQKVMIK
ncbi:MAG: hypothetical protein J6Y05_04740 [Bacteroidales bacterium]|nr:hypothetical protein [Bacteroidales bacterium]